ncbi:hypothetical protein DV738_g1877, partial [Chaetothyriales sp. CBS 135597]
MRATEDDFFNYTTKRWLFNEAYELSIRRVQFNIQALFELRGILGVPVPKILSWSSVSANAVGSEYIIMEKAKGKLLSECWYSLEREAKNHIISQIVDLEDLMASQSFAAHGCLFYQEDIPTESQHPITTTGDTMPKFAIGPSVHPSLWEDERSQLHVHKGPWKDLVSHATDIGNNELEWVMKYAKPRMNYIRDNKPEQPSEMLELLRKYLSVIPYISQCPKDSEYLEVQRLSHPDLNLSNVFVDPQTKDITSIIDWQGSRVAPLVLQAKIPRMVRHFEPLPPGLFIPEKPDNRDTLDAKALEKIHESALCQKYYEVLTAKRNPGLYSAIMHNESHTAPFIEPLLIVCGSWKNREMYKLRSSLIRIAEHWDELGPDLPECPISFGQEDVRRHDEELENIDYIQSIMEAFEKEGILPADGRVDPDDFDALSEVNKAQKQNYLLLAESQKGVAAVARRWLSDSMEELVARHKKEQRELQGRITQKKKNATKKTRKGVNDECERLERELKERQQAEINALAPPPDLEAEVEDSVVEEEKEARLLRRTAEQEAQAAAAEEEAANLPNLREQETSAMAREMAKRGLTETFIQPDGHCLYAACAHGMDPTIRSRAGPPSPSSQPPYQDVRLAVADFIANHADDFAPFLEEPVESYVKKIRDTAEWGGHLELQAIARSYNVRISILQADGRVQTFESDHQGGGDKLDEIWLAYYRHSFGLGEHYNALSKSDKT